MNHSPYAVDLRKPKKVYHDMVPHTSLREQFPERNKQLKPAPFLLRVTALWVVASFVLIPFGRVYASEEGALSTPEHVGEAPALELVPEPQIESALPAEPEAVPEFEPQSEAILPDAYSEQAIEEEVTENTVEEAIPREPSVDTLGVDSTTPLEEESTTSPEEPLAEEGDAPTDVAPASDEAQDAEPLSQTTNEVLDEDIPGTVEETLASEVSEEAEEQVSPVTPEYFGSNSSTYVFSIDDCVVVETGSFYCVQSEASLNASLPAPVVRQEQKLPEETFVRKDTEGDLEIFFTKDGLTTQVTDNTVDDDAPVYDADSGLIVWHALIDDRYQIFVHDTVTRATEQLTSAAYNSTNPHVDGMIIAWQGWEDDNWEIFVTDYGVRGVAPSERVNERLTRTGDPDMFPKVYREYVSWQTRVADEWKSYAYDLQNDTQSYLGAGTSGDIESARLVLLVERRNGAGDVEQVGYEVGTGEVIPLGSTPRAPEPVAPLSDPIEEQTGVLPSPNATTTVKTNSRDGDGGEPETLEDMPVVE